MFSYFYLEDKGALDKMKYCSVTAVFLLDTC